MRKIEIGKYQSLGDMVVVQGFKYNELEVTKVSGDTINFTIKHPFFRLSCNHENFEKEFGEWVPEWFVDKEEHEK